MREIHKEHFSDLEGEIRCLLAEESKNKLTPARKIRLQVLLSERSAITTRFLKGEITFSRNRITTPRKLRSVSSFIDPFGLHKPELLKEYERAI